jgi:CO/xanthine dehydrogenase Mo-binding subunit
MAGLLNGKELSRGTFLKGGGALVVGFSLSGLGLGRAVVAANTPNLPPDPNQVDSWLAIHADGSVSLFPPKIEFGQGTWTGFRQIVADELGVAVDSIRIPLWDSGSAHRFPNNPTSGTTGSNGMTRGGPAVRQAAAAAYQALLKLASASLGVPVSGLTAENGVVSGGGRTVSYAALVGDRLLNTTITGTEPLKDPRQYKVVGTRVRRFDVPDIVSGRTTYIQNVRVPGMWHGRPVRPRGQSNLLATTPDGSPASFTVLSVDESSVSHIPGVKVVRKGNFVGVVAPLEYDAIRAATQLKVKWADVESLPGVGNQYKAVRAAATRDAQILDYGNVDAALGSAAKVVTATYEFPYQMHGPIGPCCCIADFSSDSGTLFVQGQDAWGYRGAVSTATGVPQSNIRVVYYVGSSVYGELNGPNPGAQVDAAILSQAVGKPVRVQWMRWDINGWEPYGWINVADMKGGLDSSGKLIAYDTVSWISAANGGPPASIQIGLPLTKDPSSLTSVRGAPDMRGITSSNPPSGGGRFETFSSGDQYFPNIPNRRLTGKTIPTTLATGYIRAPGCIQAGWASESMIDELAHAADADGYLFRRSMTTHAGWLAALDAVAKASDWKPHVSASNLSDERVVSGRGIAIAGETHADEDGYTGVVAEVQVDRKTGKITVTHLYGSSDVGFAVNPGLIENQLSGMLIRGASRTLFEEVSFTKTRVTGLDWVTAPTLRFKDHPAVTTIVLDHPDEIVAASASPQALAGPRYRGAAEALEATVPAAIGNAVFDAAGIRLRQLPLTNAKVRSALKQAGRGL